MEQQKIGAFLKMLRNEKKLTQEQLAEQFNVSNRTVSRWETGSNMPDLSILIELADFYNVDIKEILNGERKSETMNNETKDTLLKVAEYNNTEKMKMKKRMIDISVGTLMILIFYTLLDATNGFGAIPAEPCHNMKVFALGLTMACLALNALYLNGFFDKIEHWMHIKKTK